MGPHEPDALEVLGFVGALGFLALVVFLILFWATDYGNGCRCLQYLGPDPALSGLWTVKPLLLPKSEDTP